MPAEFPTPAVSGSNPIPMFYEAEPEGFVVGKTVYDDNGADYKLQNGGAGVRRWILRYDGLTAAQAAILDAHLAACFYSEDEGSAFGFNFRAHTIGDLPWTSTAGTLYSGVHYAPGGYRKSHEHADICTREIILEKRP